MRDCSLTCRLAICPCIRFACSSVMRRTKLNTCIIYTRRSNLLHYHIMGRDHLHMHDNHPTLTCSDSINASIINLINNAMVVITCGSKIYTRRHHLYQCIYVDNRSLDKNQITTLPRGVFDGLSVDIL